MHDHDMSFGDDFKQKGQNKGNVSVISTIRGKLNNHGGTA